MFPTVQQAGNPAAGVAEAGWFNDSAGDAWHEIDRCTPRSGSPAEGDNARIDASEVGGRTSPDYSSHYYAVAVTTAPNWMNASVVAEEEGLWVPGDDGMYRFDDDDFADWDERYSYHTTAQAFLAAVIDEVLLEGIHAFPAEQRGHMAHCILIMSIIPFIDLCYDRLMEQIVIRFPRGGLTRKMRNRLMHALNGNGRGKPIPCVLCGAKFQPAVPGHKRCSVCIAGVFSAAGIGGGGGPAAGAAAGPAAAPAPAPAQAAPAPPPPAAPAAAAAPQPAAIQFGPPAAGAQQAARAAPAPPLKGLWATIMEEVNDLRQVAPAGYKESALTGVTRNDGATDYLSIGGSTIQGIGYVVTFDHAAMSEDYVDYSYHRQRDLRRVAINGNLHGSQDWLYSTGRVGTVAGVKMIATVVKTVQASENGRLINVDVFRLSVTQLDLSVDRRFTTFVARDAIGRHIRYSSYRGANETGIVCGNDEVVTVATNLFMECERYFVTTEQSKIAESTIRNTMKNNTAIGGDEMEALIRYHSGKHQGRVVTRNAAIGGRASVWARAKDAVNSSYHTRPWWVPGILWMGSDPYADAITGFQSIVLTMIVCMVAGCCAFYASELFAMGSIGIGHLYNIGSARFMPRKPAVMDEFSPVRFWMCGVLRDYLWWHAIGDVESGWRVEDAKCPGWGTVGKRWIESWDVWDVMIILFSPIFEEWLRRRNWHEGFLTEWIGLPGSNHPVAAWCERLGLTFVLNKITALRATHTDFGIAVTAAIYITEAISSGNFALYVGTTGMVHIGCFFLPWYAAWVLHFSWNCITAENTKRVYTSAKSGFSVIAPLFLLCATSARRGYRYISPMGTDSQFTEMMADAEAMKSFPMKNTGKVRFSKTVNQRGTSRLICLLQPFVACASFAANQANTLHSVAGRVLKDTPGVVRSLTGMESIIGKISTKMGGVEPISGEKWASKFPPMKRARYTKALLVLSVLGFAFFDSGLLGARHDWDMRNCFLKHEVNLMQPDKFIQGKGRMWKIACSDPRTIQASADEIQAAVGPFFVAAGERAAKVLDGSGESKILGWRLCAAFGKTKAEVADIIQMIEESGDNGIVDCGDDGYIIWDRKVHAIDASRWDAHVGPELLGLKKAHLLRIGMHPVLVRMLDKLVDRRGKFQGSRVKFSVCGDVASGDADTLYWNTICGLAVILDSVQGCKTFEEFAERSKQVGIEYELAATGSRACYDARLDFCSCVFVPSKKGFTLAPKLGRSLMKLSHSHNTTMKPDLLLASKIEGLSHDLAVFPEIVAALRTILPGLPKAEALSESYHAVGHAEPGTLDQRRAFIADRYGLEYLDLVKDVAVWVQRDAAFGDGNEFWRLARMVEVDYGKRPMPASPGPERPVVRRSGTIRTLFTFATLIACSTVAPGVTSVMKWKAGGLVFKTNETSITNKTHDYFMAGKGRKNNNTGAARPKNGSGRARNGRQGGGKKKQTNGNMRRGGQFRGKGDYIATGLAAAKAFGQAIPKGTFEDVGGYLGAAAGRGLANFTGVGDYVFNDIVHTPSMPTRHSNNKQRISNCEYITDLTASGGQNFTLSKLALNPGDPGSFPWLSKVAQLYQKYKFEQLIFEFRSNSSDYAASGPLGTVIMSPLYNVLADVPQTKQQLESYAHAVSSKPSNSLMCGVECDPRDDNIKWYYVRNPADSPTQFTDPGVFFTATNGLPAVSGSLGELWVHYTVKFDEPILTTRQSQQSYCRLRIANNAWGLADTNMAGLKPNGVSGTTGVGVPDSSIPAGTATFQELALNSGQPTTPYFVSLDTAVTATTQLWFSSPGTYLVDYVVNFFTGYTAITARQQLYNASIVAGNGTLSSGERLAPVGVGAGTSFAGTFTLTSTTNNCCVNFFKNPLQVTTGGANVSLDGTEAAWVRITRI